HEGYGQASDIELIGELANNMLGRTFCALGDAAAMPTTGFITKFRGEFEAYLKSSHRDLATSAPELVQVH
ncbi:MAG: NADH-quinone oxidoreductase subunit F, partial [Acidobacteriota bacterium]|nr:NADH-quinone oxidoreductase subunit F [Acidobacteriota bacterium]